MREVLIRQMGGQPYSADGKSVAYNNAGRPPRRRLVHRPRRPSRRSAQFGFLTDGVTAFRAGKAGLMIDGSFRLAAFDGMARAWTTRSPSCPPTRASAPTSPVYWVNGITPKATGAKPTPP